MELVAIRDARVDRDPFAHAMPRRPEPHGPATLMEDQQRALETLCRWRSRGVPPRCCTASPAAARPSSTCVWPSACAHRAAASWCWCPRSRSRRRWRRCSARASAPAVAIQHSGLSDGERHDQWHRIRRGDVDVVVGTRSAVFAPLADPGPHHRRRGARHLVQAGRDAAVSRARRGGDARQVQRSARGARLGDAVDGVVRQRARRPLHPGEHEPRVLDRPLAEVSIVNMREEMAEGPRWC